MHETSIAGLTVSAGIGMATSFILRNVAFEATSATVPPAERPAALARIDEAYAATRLDLDRFPAPSAEALRAMLDGPLFHGGIVDRVHSGETPEDAVVHTTQDLALIFGESPDPIFRARGEEAEEVGRRIFRHLHGLPTPVYCTKHPLILVTDEMSAFDVSRLRAGGIAGLVTERGGATSHFAIVAKQLGIPAVSGVAGAPDVIPDGVPCICDAENGCVVLHPSSDTAASTAHRIEVRQTTRRTLGHLAGRETATADGVRLRLWGNIVGPQDMAPLVEAGASGVGMFRTEFIFTGDEAPSEERQSYVYGEILRASPGPVIMRTLEAGGDKTIPYLAGEPEENPNLGWQGLRMCLEMEELFLTQLRGMLRASTAGELWIMFPFVSALWELDACKALVAKAHAELAGRGVPIGTYKVGVMIEVPSAAIMADAYLRGFDFCSIGTNDLTQFTLAADRMNPKVARWYDPFHPAVLRLIAMSAAAARRAGKPIGMAGDMASNPLAIPFLIGVGLEIFSVTAPQVPAVKETILGIDSRQAREIARHVLTLDSTEAVRDVLQSRHRTG